MTSQIKTYAERFSEDAAFVASDDSEEYALKVKTAIETGDWSALRVEGGTEPVTYNMRPLGADVLGVLVDMQRNGCGDNELCTKAFRAALVSVAGIKDVKVKFDNDEHMGRIATLSWLEDAKIPPARGIRILREIGGRVLSKAMDLDPK